MGNSQISGVPIIRITVFWCPVFCQQKSPKHVHAQQEGSAQGDLYSPKSHGRLPGHGHPRGVYQGVRHQGFVGFVRDGKALKKGVL